MTHREDGYTGEIIVNKQVRDLKRFRRMSAYIMQDHDLQPHLTVLEAMHFSANLKIGAELSVASKKVRVSKPLPIVVRSPLILIVAIALLADERNTSCHWVV